MLPNHTLCAGWGHFPKNFTQLPQLPFPSISPRWFLAASPTWWSFNHDNKSESLSPEAAATCYDRKLRAPRIQIPPRWVIFLVRAESFSTRGKFLNFTAHWSTFLAPWPYQHSNNSNEGKWWRKSPNPDLVMEGQGSWWSAACTGSSFLSHPNWQPESESSFSLRSLDDSTFQALIFTNPQEREGWNLPNDTTNINK